MKYMTVFTATVYMQNYTLTSRQPDKHTLIVIKCLQLSTNNIESATEIECRCKEQDTTTGLW